MSFDERVRYERTPGRTIGIWAAKALLVVPIVLLVFAGILFTGDGESWRWEESIWYFVASAACWVLAFFVYWALTQSEQDRTDLEDEAHHLRRLAALYAGNWWNAQRKLENAEIDYFVAADWEVKLRESAGRNDLFVGGSFEPIVLADADLQSGRISGLRVAQILALVGASLIGVLGVAMGALVAIGFARGSDPDIFVIGIPLAMIAGAAALFRSVAWSQQEIRAEKQRRTQAADSPPRD